MLIGSFFWHTVLLGCHTFLAPVIYYSNRTLKFQEGSTVILINC